MALPNHNGFIRFIYVLAILVMFGLVGWMVSASLTLEQSYAVASDAVSEEAEALEEVKVAAVAAPQYSIKKPQKRQAAYVRDRVVIAGLESRIDLSGDVQQQLDNSWREFARQDLVTALMPKEPLNVFAVYHSYSAQNNRVSVTLGYPAPKNVKFSGRIHVVTVDPGQYAVLPNEYVLDGWAKAEQFTRSLRFKGDYEIYRLTPDYQVSQFTAYMAIQ